MGDVVQFQFNEPVEVALKFAEPKMLETKYGERAMYSLADDRVMFHDTLTAAKIRALGVQPGDCFYIVKRKKGRIQEFEVFRDSEEPAPAKAPILISEEVIRAAQQPIESHPTGKKLPPVRDLAKVLDPRKFAGNGNLEQLLEQSIALAEAAKTGQQPDGTFVVPGADTRISAPASISNEVPVNGNGNKPLIATGWAQHLLEQTTTLIDVFAAAVKYSSTEHGNAVKPETVHSILLSVFINMSKANGGQRAA